MVGQPYRSKRRCREPCERVVEEAQTVLGVGLLLLQLPCAVERELRIVPTA